MSRSVNRNPKPIPPDVGAFTSEEAARYLQTSREVIQQACKAGLLGHYWVGRALRIPRTDLDEYMRRRVAETLGALQIREFRR